MHHIRHHFGEETEESFGLSMEDGEKKYYNNGNIKRADTRIVLLILRNIPQFEYNVYLCYIVGILIEVNNIWHVANKSSIHPTKI
jgi:hypothetical protein